MLTGRCNYNCLHCFNAADNAPLASQWSWENANILMDEAEVCGVNAWTLTGGEPMLHPRFLDIVHGIYDRGMFVHELNTNGAYITSDILKEFRKIGAKPLMKISFDGLGWHDWLRNHKGAEEKTLMAIRLCVEKGFPVKIQLNVHRKNIRTVSDTLQYLEDMGVEETRIIRTSESPRWEELGKDVTLSFREYYEQMLTISKEWLKRPHKMVVTIWHMDTLPLITEKNNSPVVSGEISDWDRLKSFHPKSYVCPDCRFLAAVTAEGDMVPCMQLSGYFSHRRIRLGNVMGGGLQNLLREGRYLDTVCYTLGDLLENSKSCAQCRYFWDCLGGCRVFAIKYINNYLGPDPARCIYYKEGYADRMKELFR